MKKLLKILGIVLGVVIILVLAAAAFIHFRGIPTYGTPEIPDIKVELTPERIENGKKIATMLCKHCHNGPDGSMTGRKLTDIPPEFGEIYSKNITQDPDHGIGKWTDGELIYFLRTGVRKDGTYAPPYMPKFMHASDEEVMSMVAWLRSDDPTLKASTIDQPENKPSWMVKMLAHVAFKPLPYPTAPIPKPDTTNQLAWGKYLANGLYDCFSCHSADFKTMNVFEPEKSEGFYGGGNTLIDLDGKPIKSKNLTPDAATGIGSWTEDEFVNAILNGKRKNGKQLRYPMLPYTRLTEGEAKAIYAYLKTVPPISNKVED